jgi:phosphoribosylglycinamide formyltransferase-1
MTADRVVKNVAFIASSGGGVMDALAQAQHDGFPLRICGVITDRPCGTEHVASRWGLQQVRLQQDPWETWSARAASVLRSWKPQVVILLFLRRIGPEIWLENPGMATWNLHTSLLPAYRGLNALDRNHADAVAARQQGRSIDMGTTLHRVTDDLDAGPILAQRSFTIEHASTIERARHISYLQKTELVMDQLGVDAEDAAAFLTSLAEPWARPIYRSRIEEAA